VRSESVVNDIFHSRSITKLNLRGAGAIREGVVLLAEALTSNKSISMVSINISNNALEDRGMISFAGYLQHTDHNLTCLNFSSCMLQQRGVVALAVALSTNVSTLLHHVMLIHVHFAAKSN
jgi:Ran GTPase-activating protein (RanGAP) involved in mRNA processing and transport